MGMGDPFGTTAELAYRGGSSLGEGILQASGLYAKQKQREKEMKNGFPDFLSQLLLGVGAVKGNEPQLQDGIDALLANSGMEIIGYDQRGRPMVRKIKRDVAGEKLDIELGEKEQIQKNKSQLVNASALDTLDTISEVEKGIGHFGVFGGIPSLPGTPRANWEANIDKLLSSKIVNLMTTMKEASKTGATGFGQLSEKELKVLQDASTALKRGLPKEDAQRYLNQMKETAQKILKNKSGKTSSGISYTVE